MPKVIFDFDGTIANSFDFVADFLAAEAKLMPLTQAQRKALRHMSMMAMGRALGHRYWKLPRLFYRGRRAMREQIKHVEPFEGMPDVIRKLHNEGHELFIVSSNTVENVHAFLHRHKLHTYFLEIYGGVGLFGKAPALRQLLKEQQFDVSECIYIGDELRDVEAAHAVGMRSIAVTWGFAGIKDLENLRPTALADQPDDIISILEEL